LAEVERRKADRAIPKRGLVRLTNEEQTEEEFTSAATSLSFSEDLRIDPEKGGPRRPAWMRRGLPRLAPQKIGAPSLAEKDYRK
jgi:hypothetical protein